MNVIVEILCFVLCGETYSLTRDNVQCRKRHMCACRCGGRQGGRGGQHGSCWNIGLWYFCFVCDDLQRRCCGSGQIGGRHRGLGLQASSSSWCARHPVIVAMVSAVLGVGTGSIRLPGVMF